MPVMEIDNIVLADYVDPLPSHVEGIPLLDITTQANLTEAVGTETLYFCPDPWALRHRFISPDGEVVRARCDKWSCEYCGPRKTDQWRQLIAAAEPQLHIVLSRAGHTIEEAARALTTFVQYLRRGSKGRGKAHVGAREAYAFEYFAVLERHANFEETGFHWHLLVSSVDFIPKEVVDKAWASATKSHFENPEEGNKWAFIQRVNNARAIGYVTKYLTKDIVRSEKGTKERRVEVKEKTLDVYGEVVETKQVYVYAATSHARRIRYSRHFFPESVEELRFRLFSGLDNPEGIERDLVPANHPNADLDGTLVVEVSDEKDVFSPSDELVQPEILQEEEPTRPKWALYEAEPFTCDYQEYRARRRRALLESLMLVRARTWRISGRILSVWAFQRSQKGQRKYQPDDLVT
jgi:hypothetical protein